MEIKGWAIRGGKLEERDFTAEFSSDEFVSLVMKRKFEQIQERAMKAEKSKGISKIEPDQVA